jgi:hypothetical protein
LIGAGTGGGAPEKVLRFMVEEAKASEFEGEVRIVVFNRKLAADAAACVFVG